MQLRTLRIFTEVVRQGGFSQAGKAVFATQSTVSKAVKQLEDELGVRLLDRIGHKSQLTAAGEVVYRRALRIQTERDDMIAELEDLRGLRRGTLRLGLPPIGSSHLFAPMFAAYRERYPGIDIRLLEHGSARLEEILLTGEIELAASLLPVADDFDWQDVRCEPLMAILPKSHRLAGEAAIGIEQLREDPFILFEAGFGLNRVIADACRRHGFEPMVSARSSQIDFIIELAGAGVGIAFLPKLILERRTLSAATAVLLDEPQTDWHMALVWRRGAYLSHAAKAWLELAAAAKPG